MRFVILHHGVDRDHTVVGHVTLKGCRRSRILKRTSTSKRVPAAEEARGGRMPNVLIEMEHPVCCVRDLERYNVPLPRSAERARRMRPRVLHETSQPAIWPCSQTLVQDFWCRI